MKKRDRYDEGWLDGWADGTAMANKRNAPNVWLERMVGIAIAFLGAWVVFLLWGMFELAVRSICAC